ncbi:hypothetical protein HK097_001918 [Rhizophlyctis rosea]|uniref:Uncharacterized protein n=1 Tax=Rhizophlyctis rosea TaxID=64517 RepID=A0AAD5SKA8_9FUNG|nr:hypothetical protein HK097_001918 [Rhizophlyctis rosea]
MASSAVQIPPPLHDQSLHHQNSAGGPSPSPLSPPSAGFGSLGRGTATPGRKLSVVGQDSPVAVNFHTWRINALTNNAYRWVILGSLNLGALWKSGVQRHGKEQVQFLEHARKAWAGATPSASSNALRVLADLHLPTPTLKEAKKKSNSDQHLAYAGLVDLLQSPINALADQDWLSALKTYTSPFPELYDEVKDAFGVRDKDDLAGIASSTMGDASEGGDLAIDTSSQRLSRRLSRQVTWDENAAPAEQEGTRFPPTPFIEREDSPFESAPYAPPPAQEAIDDPLGGGSDEADFAAMQQATFADPDQPELCLNGQRIEYDLHVAMMDRPAETRELASRNAEFFSSIRHCCAASDAEWAQFEELFFAPRESVDDLTWIRGISKTLKDAPSLLATLKELVGYDHFDEIEKEEEQKEALYTRDTPFDGQEGWMETIVKIREHPEILSRLETDYPQFFANCKQALDGEQPKPDEIHQSEYEKFTETFFSAPTSVPDIEWQNEVRRYLSKGSNLVAQLRDIAIYELDLDEAQLEELPHAPSDVAQLAEQLGETRISDPFAPPPGESAVDLDEPYHASNQQYLDPLIYVRVRSDAESVKALEASHPGFFEEVKRTIGDTTYARFLRALQFPRNALPDDRWEALIAHRFLGSSRQLREEFREIVGAVVAETGEPIDSDDEEWEGHFHVFMRDGGKEGLDKFWEQRRDLLERVKGAVGARKFAEFEKLLRAERTQVGDDEWVEEMEELLDQDAGLISEFAMAAGVGQIHKADHDVDIGLGGGTGYFDEAVIAASAAANRFAYDPMGLFEPVSSQQQREGGLSPLATTGFAGVPQALSPQALSPGVTSPQALPSPALQQQSSTTQLQPLHRSGSPDPSETSTAAYMVREQLPGLIPQLELYAAVKGALDDEKIFGRVLHAYVERTEREKHGYGIGNVIPPSAVLTAELAAATEPGSVEQAPALVIKSGIEGVAEKEGEGVKNDRVDAVFRELIVDAAGEFAEGLKRYDRFVEEGGLKGFDKGFGEFSCVVKIAV